MNCTEFVQRFSDIQDGTAFPEEVRLAHEHIAACTSCARYREVFERGVALLRSLPAPEINEDFGPRLQHRIYSVDEEAALRRHTSSGTTAVAVLGMALLLSAVAWAPMLRPSAPVVELPPIVVNSPPPAVRARSVASYSAFAGRSSQAAVTDGLWGDARTVLFEYSRLARRYGQASSPGRPGLEQDR